MRYSFYDSKDYRKIQSEKMKKAWQAGHFNSLIIKIENKICFRPSCSNIFIPEKNSSPKKFCSRHCSAIYNNLTRGPRSQEVKLKISEALRGRRYEGRPSKPLLVKFCLTCRKKFTTFQWKNNKYCSVQCSIYDIGRRRTSPKAARAKSGIRPDIDTKIYFFSRWEANFARILNLLKIKWVFQPEAFDLKFQKYTPDFYLPEYDLYVEIKNFLSDYSVRRDQAFRKLYPNKNLSLILKPEYIKLQSGFAEYIEEWEFS